MERKAESPCKEELMDGLAYTNATLRKLCR